MASEHVTRSEGSTDLYGVSKCCRTLNTISTVSRTLTSQVLHMIANSRPMIRSMSGQGLSPFWLTTSEQEVPAVCLPWYDHVNRSTRESSHAPSYGELDIHGTLRPSHRGGGLQTCDSCRFGRSLALPLHVCSGSLFEGSLTLLWPGRRSWARVLRARAYLPPDTCRTRRTSRHRDPISGRRAQRPWNWRVGAADWEAPTATVSACHVCPRPRRVRSACNVTVRVLKCNCLFQSGGIQRHTSEKCNTMSSYRAVAATLDGRHLLHAECPRVEHESRADFSNGNLEATVHAFAGARAASWLRVRI